MYPRLPFFNVRRYTNIVAFSRGRGVWNIWIRLVTRNATWLCILIVFSDNQWVFNLNYERSTREQIDEIRRDLIMKFSKTRKIRRRILWHIRENTVAAITVIAVAAMRYCACLLRVITHNSRRRGLEIWTLWIKHYFFFSLRRGKLWSLFNNSNLFFGKFEKIKKTVVSRTW